jgi:predicted ester cyclase
MALEERRLTKALKSQYPSLTDSQRERLQAAIIREVAAAIARGDHLAILKPLPDGSFEISRMVIERAARAAAIQK